MKDDKKGFTIAELLIVVAIIGVLVAIAIPVFISQLENSRRAVDLSNARDLKSCLANLYNDGTIKFDAEGAAWVIVTKDKAYFCTNGKAWPKVNGKTSTAAANELESLINACGLKTNDLKVTCQDASANWSLYLVYISNDGKIGAYSTTDPSAVVTSFDHWRELQAVWNLDSNIGSALKGE